MDESPKALNRFGDWFSDAWRDLTEDFSAMLPFGGIYLGLFVFLVLFNCCLGAIPGVGALGAFILSFVVQGVAQCGMCGVALAKMHGRSPAFLDFQQTGTAHLHSVGFITIQTMSAMLLGFIAMIPGLALVLIGVSSQAGTASQTPGDLYFIAGFALIFVLVLPVFIAIQTLLFFTIPIIVDKRVDVITAISMSARCVMRDPLGLAIFVFVWYLVMGLLIGCTFLVGAIFFAPFVHLIQMHAYREYFGLEPDALAGLANQLEHDPYRYPLAPPPPPDNFGGPNDPPPPPHP